MKRTKLCLKVIYELAELFLSKCYFLWNNEIRILKNPGPIGLYFMVALYESYVQNLEHKAIPEALTLNLVPKTYRRYVDDTHAQFKSKKQSRAGHYITLKQKRKSLANQQSTNKKASKECHRTHKGMPRHIWLSYEVSLIYFWKRKTSRLYLCFIKRACK